jgi:hypothetical protein
MANPNCGPDYSLFITKLFLTIRLADVGAWTSHKPMGLRYLLQGYSFAFRGDIFFSLRKNVRKDINMKQV